MAGLHPGLVWMLCLACFSQVCGYANPSAPFGSHRVTKSLIVKRNENQRVSFRDCNLVASERRACGYPGISRSACAQRECCWMETDDVDVPWCFNSRSTLQPQCIVDPDERLECGSYGIRKEQCLALECCWQPTPGDAPWCYHILRLPIYEGECGVPAIPPNVRSRIINGVEARPHSWPWIVSIQMRGGHYCGASIINHQWLMSAAHCWPGAMRKRLLHKRGSRSSRSTDIFVLLGLHSKGDKEETTVLEFEVEQGYVHEDFETVARENYLENDILLMKLAEPLNFTDAISPVCLPEQGEEFPGGTHAYAAGWGTTRGFPDPEVKDELQQVLLPIVDRDTCNDWYEEMFSEDEGFHEYFEDRPITERMQCAGYEEGGRSACYGDSGGPLVVYKEDHWVQVGLTSWGGHWACNRENMPSVYTKVSSHIDWIVDIISRNTP